MADAAVRPATSADAAEIPRLQLSTWRTAYTALLPTEVLSGVDEAAAAAHWRDTIDGGPAGGFGGAQGGGVGRFGAAGPAPLAESAGADGSPPADAAQLALVSTLVQ